jgi:hypothetical protein
LLFELYFSCLLAGVAGGAPIEDIYNLYDNDWASRIWTIQELALATKPRVGGVLEILGSLWQE